MYELVATCMFGLEKFLGEEIDALIYEVVNDFIWIKKEDIYL